MPTDSLLIQCWNNSAFGAVRQTPATGPFEGIRSTAPRCPHPSFPSPKLPVISLDKPRTVRVTHPRASLLAQHGQVYITFLSQRRQLYLKLS